MTIGPSLARTSSLISLNGLSPRRIVNADLDSEFFASRGPEDLHETLRSINEGSLLWRRQRFDRALDPKGIATAALDPPSAGETMRRKASGEFAAPSTAPMLSIAAR